MTTLPQPKLAQLGMMWMVTSGTLKLNNAFTHQDDAVTFAKSLDAIGTRVSLGHTVFGWVDFFDPRQSDKECAELINAWHDSFMIDPWHKARWAEAVSRGEFTV